MITKPSAVLEHWHPDNHTEPGWTQDTYILQDGTGHTTPGRPRCCAFGYLALQAGLPPPNRGQDWDIRELEPLLLHEYSIDLHTLTEGTRINDQAYDRERLDLSCLPGVITYLREKGL